jgi:hypothetical protein
MSELTRTFDSGATSASSGTATPWRWSPTASGGGFVHGPGSLEPLLQEERGEVFAYVTDQVGVPRELVDGAGGVGGHVDGVRQGGRGATTLRVPLAAPLSCWSLRDGSRFGGLPQGSRT